MVGQEIHRTSRHEVKWPVNGPPVRARPRTCVNVMTSQLLDDHAALFVTAVVCEWEVFLYKLFDDAVNRWIAKRQI
jgi:hypothetical protein